MLGPPFSAFPLIGAKATKLQAMTSHGDGNKMSQELVSADPANIRSQMMRRPKWGTLSEALLKEEAISRDRTVPRCHEPSIALSVARK